MIEVTPRLVIPNADLSVQFVRSGGPGGQNVNKVATKVELRLNLNGCEVLSAGVKQRLREAYPSAVTKGGEFMVSSSRHRTQAQNRRDADEKLAEMIRSVLTIPRKRRPTRPSRGARERRLEIKRHTAHQKSLRRVVRPREE